MKLIMEYETKLRIEINDLLSKYNYEPNSIERQRIEQLIEDCKAKNIEISYAINFLEEKLKVRINKKEIDNLKSIDFFKYAEITLGRKLENEEILEMVSSFNITPKELNESISLINNNKFSELQDLINKNIITTIVDIFNILIIRMPVATIQPLYYKIHLSSSLRQFALHSPGHPESGISVLLHLLNFHGVLPVSVHPVAAAHTAAGYGSPDLPSHPWNLKSLR